MTTFALVHGGWHGAWCWELLAPLLRDAGHEVVAMDLPIENGSATFDSYADAVCAAIEGCNDVVVVGHSMSGHTIPLVAARRAVRHLVYLCAYIPDIGRSLRDQFIGEAGMTDLVWLTGLSEPDAQNRQAWANRTLAREMLFADCDDATAEAAINRLRRQANYPGVVPLPEFPSVSCTSVICIDDRMVGYEWAKKVAHDRLGTEPIELPGDHSPFLSRPSALAEVLLHVADGI
jgi:pimeloyl-ACP methyl ester carboxylesterase